MRARRAWAAVHDLLAPRFVALCAKQRLQTADAEDVVQEALVRAAQHAAQCAALDLADDDAERGVLAWAYTICRRLIVDVHRKRKREPLAASSLARDEADAPPKEAGPSVPAPDDDESVEARTRSERLRLQSLRLAHRHARALVSTGEPQELRDQARRAGVPASPAGIDGYVALWVAVRARGEATLDVGRREGMPGTDKQVRGRVSQRVRRGAAALRFGALRAATRQEDPELTEDLEALAVLLAKPLRCPSGGATGGSS